MNSKLSFIGIQSQPAPIEGDVVVGKDVLELFAGAMYADPLSIFREYVQNAADAIDEARQQELTPNEEADISIVFDHAARSIRIRDFGAGLPNSQFMKRLTSIGASKKRGTEARGFRGIGRLSGLGYCQELIFRSRSVGDKKVKEMKWDGRVLRERLRDTNFAGTLSDLVREVAVVTDLPSAEYPAHFFEVELSKVLRVRNDILLNEEAVRGYLSEVAPVPFDPKFKLGKKIAEFLEAHGVHEPIRVVLNDKKGQIFHRAKDHFPISPKVLSKFTDVKFLEHRDSDGELLSFGWLLDHAYSGAIARSLRLGGIRLRHKNVQVGDGDILSSCFTETRFSQWGVGDIHVAHPRIVPNARRDDFEHTPAHGKLIDEMRQLTREITQTIRSRSDQRTRLRKVQFQLTYAAQWLEGSEAAKSSLMVAAMVDRAAAHVAEAEKALGKLPETAPDYGLVKEQLERTQDQIAKRVKARKKDWSTESSYAAVFAILSSSSKMEAVLPLAERVVSAMKSADSAKQALAA